jgi:hypothetical protein
LINLGLLTFAPDTPEVRTLINELNTTLPLFNSVYGGLFPSEDAATEHALRDLTKDEGWSRTNPYRKRTWALFSFHKLDIDNGIVDYTMRMNYSVLPSTRVGPPFTVKCAPNHLINDDPSIVCSKSIYFGA